MSEKGREMTKEEEEVILDHFLHDHPLALTETRVESICHCCRRRFYGEVGYSCSKKCGSDFVIHEECAEMPRSITHPTHPPQHTLTQTKETWAGECAVCELDMRSEVGYHCSSSGCYFHMHMRCASSMGVMCVAGDDHSMSHPQHQLRSWRRPGRSCSFRCDACGTRQHGSSYVCVACQYWIHESCAALALTAQFPHHQHPLSLDFHFPIEYVMFNFKCDICRKPLLRKHWVYHCRLCRYVVHIKCAITASSVPPNTLDNEVDVGEDEDVIQFPINDIAEELIRPFVMRVGAAHDEEEENINAGKYKFHNHHHQLSLVSSSSSPSHDDHQEEEENSSDDDDYNLNYGQTSKLVCDGCTAPIYHEKKKSSSSSHINYYSCVEGKYFLHWACFRLPLELRPSQPFHRQHKKQLLRLQTCPKLDWIKCSICKFYTNGLYYSCAECEFKADIKCSSLPSTIKHEAHPQRHHYLKLVDGEDYKDSLHIRCIGCSEFLLHPGAIFYTCQKCEFNLCCRCVLLPGTADTRWLDKHALPLAFEAAVNHPEKFYCDECEKEMNPKCWMYHCRHCDASYHPRCLPTVAPYCRDFKYGREFAIAAIHHHPLTLERFFTKLRCHVCGNKERNDVGFRCASCNFFACGCGEWSNDDVLPLD
ncbi:uncharacterized protein LOC131005057 [Salvia miltiorrhiza]|uniref:uncharacterized protein LOC131005057 n=1 Tax=Salvia miltiorrhiza TaxID=226208 RepID=UPI0025AD90A3|nr:uncharacterized protein LOC131005057 [Salvia miltiorrhiza]